MKRVFLTFADRRLHRSVTRISKQAEAMRAYDVIQSADETWLEGSFRRKFADKLVRGSRGFGYWCWKPQLLLQTFQALCDSDIVQYTDAGCHMNPLGRRRLLQYFAMTDASSTGILAFQARPPEAPLVYDGRKLPDWRES